MSTSSKDFVEAVAENIKQDTLSAILRTVVEDPSRTLGNLFDSLEATAEKIGAGYLVDAFREIQIGEIVQAGMNNILAHQQAQADGEVIVESVEEAVASALAPAKAPPAKAPTKEAAPKEATSKKKPPNKPTKDDGAIELSTPDALKKYEAAILKTLKDGEHTSKSESISSAHLRKVVGGSADQGREMLNSLIEGKRVKYTGKARGTRYWRVA